MRETPKRYVYITKSKTGNRNWQVRYSRKHRSATAATFDSWRYAYPDVLHWVNSQGVYILQLPPEQRREIAEKKKAEQRETTRLLKIRDAQRRIVNARQNDDAQDLAREEREYNRTMDEILGIRPRGI